jgi:hypothetical protein
MSFVRSIAEDNAIPGITDPDGCVKDAYYILKNTGHLPSVGGVAAAVGRCAYYARMVESLGVKRRSRFLERISGKGDKIHKILGMAVLMMFKETGFSSSVDYGVYIKNSYEKLKSLGILVDEIEEEDLEEAVHLLRRLMNHLNRFCEIIGVSRDRLFPIVEQSMISYELHMRGVPDLILEDRMARAAIVVDWKTRDEDVYRDDIAQVTAYAMLEGIRLGYDINEIKEKILGSYPRGDGAKILPVILRPGEKAELKPHPALAPPDKVEKRYEELRDILDKIMVAAEHLTLLLTNHRALLGIKTDETYRCMIQLKNLNRRVNALRVTPEGLLRGSPKNQNRYPCVSNDKPICHLMDACRFYFGELDRENTEAEKKLWDLRYRVLEKRESSLFVYKALEILFKRGGSKETLIDNFSRGSGALVDIGREYARPERLDPSSMKRIDKKLMIKTPLGNTITKKIDMGSINNVGNNLILSISRQMSSEGADDAEWYRVIRDGATVLISLLDGSTPNLSINVYARIADVDINIEKGEVIYTIDSPSKIMRYQLAVFAEYVSMINRLREMLGIRGNVFMCEVDADFTHMDLEIIHELHRMIRKDEELKKAPKKYSPKDLDELRSPAMAFTVLLRRGLLGG